MHIVPLIRLNNVGDRSGWGWLHEKQELGHGLGIKGVGRTVEQDERHFEAGGERLGGGQQSLAGDPDNGHHVVRQVGTH